MTRLFFLNAALRLSALGGKFVFLLVAAAAMTQEEFGRVGVVLGTAVLIIAVVGLEGYQTLLRRIAQGTDTAGTRAFYARFAVGGAALSGIVASVIFVAYGWPREIVILAALVVACEHLNIEVCRMLIGEGRATLSILAMSARTGLWAIGLPLLSAARILPFQWSETLVLSAWLICSVAGCLCWVPLFQSYSEESPSVAQLWERYAELARLSAVWVLITLGWRAIDTGGRLITASLLSDAPSGRFTLLSTLASLSLVACKGIIEPMYFSKVMTSNGDEHLKRFAKATILVTLAAAAGSLMMAAFYNAVLGERGIAVEEWPVLIVLTFAFGLLSISQIWHFDLYRKGKDRAILWPSLAGGVSAVIVALSSLHAYGILGAAVGVLAGAAVMAALKWWLARSVSS